MAVRPGYGEIKIPGSGEPLGSPVQLCVVWSATALAMEQGHALQVQAIQPQYPKVKHPPQTSPMLPESRFNPSTLWFILLLTTAPSLLSKGEAGKEGSLTNHFITSHLIFSHFEVLRGHRSSFSYHF